MALRDIVAHLQDFLWYYLGALLLLSMLAIIAWPSAEPAGIDPVPAQENLRLQQELDAAGLDAQEAQQRLASCETERDAVAAQAAKSLNQSKLLVDSLGDELGEKSAALDECEEGLERMEEKDSVIADAARRLCCMQRVDNPAIDSFSIEGGRITCKEGGEEKVSC